ncbi:399_t:CDS:1, partial [Racocetra persica]
MRMKIIHVIANDIESTLTQILKVVESTIPLVNYSAAAIPSLSTNLIDVTNPYIQIDLFCKKNQKQSSDYVDLDAQDEKEKQSDYIDNEKDTELDEEE